MAINKSAKLAPAPEGKRIAQSQPVENSFSKGTFNFFSGRNSIFVSVLLFALVAAVFLPALRNDFLFWYGDDPGYVTENIHVKNGFTLDGIKWAFRNVELGNWHPLTFLSHMLDSQIYGLKPWGHHLTNVLFHAANTLLLFNVLRRMTGARWRSLAAALLFGLHPLRVESVAWVAERKDVLAAFFWTVTLWFYARFAEESKLQSPKSKVFYALSLVGFSCGLMSKGMVVTLPFAFLLLDYWPLKRYEQKSFAKLSLEKIPFIGLAIATSIITFAAQKNWGFVQTAEKYSLLMRLENALVSYVRYVGKMFWPMDLCGYYPHPGKWPMAVVLFAAVFVIGISVVAIVVRRKQPWLPVGWFWYLGTLVPVIGIVQLGDAAMADRYSYIPMIGFLVALVWGWHEWTRKWKQQIVFTSAALVATLGFCTVLTLKQITHFKDSVALWRHNFKVTGNVEVAQHALGMSLDQQGHTEDAIRELQAVVKAKPIRHDVRFNLATIYQSHGRIEEAIEQYYEILKLSSGSNDTRYNLGLALLQQNRNDDAIVQFQQMIKMNHDPRAFNAMGMIVASNGKLDDAIGFFKEAVKAKANYVEAHSNLGVALADKGAINEAAEHFREALKLDPNSTVAREYLHSFEVERKARP